MYGYVRGLMDEVTQGFIRALPAHWPKADKLFLGALCLWADLNPHDEDARKAFRMALEQARAEFGR